ncbi:MAG: hypothetical protein ACREMG_06530, partial [Gemmatimonadales bacterium]
PESGKNSYYPSARALGAAIRRGDLGPQARIFHQTTNQWLPITVHPEYRRVEAEEDQLSAQRLRRKRWTFLSLSGPELDGTPEGYPPPPEYPASGPILVPGELEPSWLGSTFRRLRNLAHLRA